MLRQPCLLSLSSGCTGERAKIPAASLALAMPPTKPPWKARARALCHSPHEAQAQGESEEGPGPRRALWHPSRTAPNEAALARSLLPMALAWLWHSKPVLRFFPPPSRSQLRQQVQGQLPLAAATTSPNCRTERLSRCAMVSRVQRTELVSDAMPKGGKRKNRNLLEHVGAVSWSQTCSIRITRRRLTLPYQSKW